MKYGDIVFGAVGTAGTFGLGAVNAVLGCIAGLLTIAVLLFRLRREWKNRNSPPNEE